MCTDNLIHCYENLAATDWVRTKDFFFHFFSFCFSSFFPFFIILRSSEMMIFVFFSFSDCVKLWFSFFSFSDHVKLSFLFVFHSPIVWNYDCRFFHSLIMWNCHFHFLQYPIMCNSHCHVFCSLPSCDCDLVIFIFEAFSFLFSSFFVSFHSFRVDDPLAFKLSPGIAKRSFFSKPFHFFGDLFVFAPYPSFALKMFLKNCPEEPFLEASSFFFRFFSFLI